MRRYALLALVPLAALVLGVALPPRQVDAIPAFARKYRFSCTTCHGPFPRLKPFGEEFAARGFRLEDPAQEPPRAEVDVGDPLLRLAREFPIAARLEGYGALREDAAAEGDVEFPWVFKILSGGPLSEKISYYFYFIVEKNEVEALEDAYLQFTGLFGSGVDLLFGQFQVSDPLFKRELRLERRDYEIYQTRVGEVRTNLTYDRGVVFSGTAPGGVDVVVEVVNGNGIPGGEFDRDRYKNVGLRLAREVGGARLGVFGYWGKEEGDNGRTSELTYLGPDLALTFADRWALNLQYLERRDDDPFFTGTGSSLTTRGGFAELHFFPGGEDGRWALSGLYNRVDSDDPAAEAESLSATVNYLLARNVRLLAEVGRDLSADRNEASLGVVAAF